MPDSLNSETSKSPNPKTLLLNDTPEKSPEPYSLNSLHPSLPLRLPTFGLAGGFGYYRGLDWKNV